MAEAAVTQPTTTPDPARPGSADREAIAGLVERVTFHNPDNGFCVLRVKVRRQGTRAVGTDPGLATGPFRR